MKTKLRKIYYGGDNIDRFLEYFCESDENELVYIGKGASGIVYIEPNNFSFVYKVSFDLLYLGWWLVVFF